MPDEIAPVAAPEELAAPVSDPSSEAAPHEVAPDPVLAEAAKKVSVLEACDHACDHLEKVVASIEDCSHSPGFRSIMEFVISRIKAYKANP